MSLTPGVVPGRSDLATGVLDSCGLVCIVSDLETGHVVTMNSAAERLTDFRIEDVEGRPIWESLISPADRERVENAFVSPGKGQTASHYEGELTTRSGYGRRVVWLSSFLHGPQGPDRVAMIGIDVSSDRTRAGMFGPLMRAATSVCCLATDPEGVVTFVSTGAEELLGRPAADLMGHRLPPDLFDPEEIREWAEELGVAADVSVVTHVGHPADRRRPEAPDLGSLDRRRKDVTPGGPIEGSRTRDWTLVRRGGARVRASVAVHALTVMDQNVGHLLIAEDTTDRQRTHDLLVAALQQERDAFERLRELDRAKSTFVATVSHELRTPITSIAGFTELLQDASDQLTTAQASFVDAIARNSERLRLLTDDLLVLSGIESGAFDMARSDIDLRDVIAAARDILDPMSATRDLDISYLLPSSPVMVWGDSGRLERVVVNLVGNAIKFTPDGGSVTCELGPIDTEAVLTVADTGVGIPVDEQAQLFTQFFRASTAREHAIQGTGLGLSIVAAIVQGHDGTVSVASEEPCGTRFTVRLPLAAHR